MRSAFKGWMLAAGLALAGLAPAAAQPAATEGNAASAPAAVGTIGNSANTAERAPDQAPTAPQVAADGAPVLSAEPIIGQPTDRLMSIQPQVTKNGQRAMGFHNNILLPLIVIICLLVLVLLVWVVIRYRQAANPIPSKTSHNTIIEVVWTLAPVLILVAIAVPSIGLLSAQYKPAPAGAVTLKAIGNQWYWSYQYPDHGGVEITANMLKEKDEVAAGERFRTDADGPRLLATDNRVVLPVGVPIRLITTANDVIHSWAIPAFWIKLDAVPGRLNETSFTIEKPGVYFGQCSELCGARHAYMPIAVEAVPPAQFAAWIRSKGGSMPGAAQPSSAEIPQPGADNSASVAADANTADMMTGPTQNATAEPATSPQGATGNPGGTGDTGR
ncbi:cytochrome c oxidase subunit II [Sphingomonas sp. ABOLG]|jgi:cytochrome c oxidase subunit 2|uniref:Cytochrome c oxidase subunit 2 n=1 Tax=Sphingomonas olei TaxID=1886787 RepID=A0ABY2QLA5_9SPHN|nr:MULTISPECIES: cytochrome c oxidase subunit II [Sphingomonas]KKI18874.1 cytochrome c oxidase subunit II [Sphingomonas sp. Ag1]RSV18172.1 cytochrome c oxidase subunit II [Sphingomonas sp. ABOLG]THG40873.1 cytochrome c oxidase subunit II [Sphingomonas olei]